MKVYPIADTATETKEFIANGTRYSLAHRHKFDYEQYESVELDKRELMRLYMAIQDCVLNNC